jgi:uncharacterized protein YabE (DUF348 family)
MHESCECNSNVTAERDLHLEKQAAQSLLTEGGMQIDESDGQSANADARIDESREPDSKVTVERERQRRKQQTPSSSTEDGMQIDESAKQS